MAEPGVHYCTSADDTRIAYRIEGAGPTLVVCPMAYESFSLDHLHPTRPGFFEALGRGRTLVRYDWRGTGLSQRSVSDPSLSAMTADLAAVVTALPASFVSVFAPTLAGPMANKFAAEHPDAVRSLILYGTFARVQDVWPVDVLQGFATMARVNWQMAARMFGDMGGSREEAETALATGKVIEESTGGAFVAMFTEHNIALDVEPLLGQLPARSLLLYRVDDSVVRLSVGQALAAAIPNARLVPLQGKTHGAFSGNWERVVGLITEFLDEDPETRALTVVPPPAPASDSTLRTVLFTDLVGHTEMMQRLGDERGRDVLREHERITRDVLNANGGTEVKTMGDGFMASFGGVTKAVECAVALQRAFTEREGEPLSVRVGLNAGEPIEEDGDLFGAAVILASRIAAKANAGEIFVSDNVRSLSAGKGFLFADRGEFVAKGFEEPVRVYDVKWRE